MAASTRGKRPGDLTGMRKAKLAEEHLEELKAKAAEVTLMDSPAPEIIDVTEEALAAAEEAQVVDGPVEVKQATRTMRVNDTIAQMTFGHGTSYDFEPGQVYRVPDELYRHLDEKGYVYH